MRAFLIPLVTLLPLVTLVAMTGAAIAPSPALAQSASGNDMGQRETTLDQMTPGPWTESWGRAPVRPSAPISAPPGCR